MGDLSSAFFPWHFLHPVVQFHLEFAKGSFLVYTSIFFFKFVTYIKHFRAILQKRGQFLKYF